jgi:hypothetical protein
MLERFDRVPSVIVRPELLCLVCGFDLTRGSGRLWQAEAGTALLLQEPEAATCCLEGLRQS